MAIISYLDNCVYLSSRSFVSKDGKHFCILSFMYGAELYSDVFIDAKFSDFLSSLVFGDFLNVELNITRFNGRWNVAVSSITLGKEVN